LSCECITLNWEVAPKPDHFSVGHYPIATRGLSFDDEVCGLMGFDPKRIAVEYYFGDFQYWKLPRLAADALAEGYDGAALRRIAGLANPVATDIRTEEVDSAFREMGVDAPIAKDEARMILAVESARKALDGRSSAFDEATHIRIHLCELSEPPDALQRIVSLSKEAAKASPFCSRRIEADLRTAFKDLVGTVNSA
jgi:hypothetical protein